MREADAIRRLLRAAERASSEEQWALLCFVAGSEVAFDPAERSAAIRRAELLLATGGDPRRPLELYGRAVTALAQDLDDGQRRAELLAGLAGLTPHVEGLRGMSEALRILCSDEELAWQCLALAVLAEALSDDEAETAHDPEGV